MKNFFIHLNEEEEFTNEEKKVQIENVGSLGEAQKCGILFLVQHAVYSNIFSGHPFLHHLFTQRNY